MQPLVRLAPFLVFLAVGCSATTAPAQSSEPLKQTVDGVNFTVTLKPSPPQANQNTEIEVVVTGPSGQPIPDSRMVVSMDSRAHAMAPNVSNAEPRGNGAYVATMKPTGMTGMHSMKVNIQWQNKAYQASFENVNVR